MKNTNRRPKKNIFKKCGWGGLLSLCNISLIGVGFSSWVISSDNNASADINVEVSKVTQPSGTYFKVNSTNGITNLLYCKYGFVYDDVVSTKGHLIYQLTFYNKNYLTAIGQTSASIGFDFILGYNSYASGYTLVESYLSSCALSVGTTSSSSNLLSENLTPTTDSTNHNTTFTTSDKASTTTSNTVVFIKLDFTFSVAYSDFSTIYTNELSKNPTFSLKAIAEVR